MSGFLGYLLYSVYVYVKQFYYKRLNYSFLFLLLSINFLVLQIMGWFNVGLFIVILIVTIFLTIMNASSIKNILYRLSIGCKNISTRNFIRIYEILIFILTVIFIFSLYEIIPSEFVVGTNKINIFSHYIGYCFGVFVPLIIETIYKVKGK